MNNRTSTNYASFYKPTVETQIKNFERCLTILQDLEKSRLIFSENLKRPLPSLFLFIAVASTFATYRMTENVLIRLFALFLLFITLARSNTVYIPKQPQAQDLTFLKQHLPRCLAQDLKETNGFISELSTSKMIKTLRDILSSFDNNRYKAKKTFLIGLSDRKHNSSLRLFALNSTFERRLIPLIFEMAESDEYYKTFHETNENSGDLINVVVERIRHSHEDHASEQTYGHSNKSN